jgi:zinc D-Ala-D-Ala carboxypeptidase
MIRSHFIVPALAALLLLSLAGCAKSQGNDTPSGAAAPVSSASVQLQSMTSTLPQDIQTRIAANVPSFLALLKQVLAEPSEYIVLVDKNHPLAADYAPPDLVPLDRYGISVSRNDLEMRRAIMPDVQDMVSAARADNVTLLFSSAYRSYDYQRYVYNREIKLYGQKVADSESAIPGNSQHQLGTAADFGSITDAFADTEASKWLIANAWKYGFSLSYPKGYEDLTGYRFEPWHYRYIGKPAARMARDYFDDIQQYLLLFLHDNRAQLDALVGAAS